MATILDRPTTTQCAHCGLPAPASAQPNAAAFCCTGCEIAYQALAHAGFDATYYALRNTESARPSANAAPQDALLAELDADAFLDKHAQHNTDGSTTLDLYLDGVHCAACVWLVERLPHVMPGVVSARLDLPRARLRLVWHPEQVKLSAVAQWLAQFGYAAHPKRMAAQDARSQAERSLLIRMGICWALAGNVMLLAFAFYSGLNAGTEATLTTAARWASFVLATLSVGYGGQVFIRKAWASVRFAWASGSWRSLHMDLPISLGIVVGYGHSTWATVTGQGEVWFDSIAVLIAALLTARWLHLRSRRLAGEASDRLLALIPTSAQRVAADGSLEIVEVAALAVGDTVVVAAGAVVPADGIVTEGHSTLDKSVLTGESAPEAIAPGQAIAAGVLNHSRPLRLRVTAVGEATHVGRLLAWVRDNDAEAEHLTLTDRLGGVFVAAVLLLALLTAVVWSMLDPSVVVTRVVALLVITCPCALGMATPLVMAVATAQAARRGLFIKHDAVFQRLATIDTLVLDKTGTLTEGRMRLVDWEGDTEALDLAATLETQSEHPIAVAFVEARRLPVPAEPLHYTAEAGAGLQGWLDDHHVVVGRPDWVAAFAPLSDEQQQRLNGWAERGLTPVVIAIDDAIRGLCAFGDPLRANAHATLDHVRQNGYTLHLCSGDDERVVAQVAERLGMATAAAHGRITPDGKRAFVEQLQHDGQRVLMLGDGVNDAAALQAADVGVAIHGSTTASLVAADVFLTASGVEALPPLFDGARRSLVVIRRSLALSLGYNVLGAAAAIAGLVTPLVAAIAMPISSLAVVAFALTQRSFRLPRPVSP
ncbi:MAG: heavy metal translocating P-type ATPase metal-binding domain-containing protein [Rhodothermales bacterium]